MEKTRQYMIDVLESEVKEENQLASLSLQHWEHYHQSIEEVLDHEECESEKLNALKETNENDWVNQDDVAVISIGEGLCLLACAVFFFAIIYLGCYIHSSLKTPQYEQPKYEPYYHYQIQEMPYTPNMPYQFQNIPYELNDYFFQQLFN